MPLISISEYAKAHGRKPDSVKHMALRGRFNTAHKIGFYWVIESDEPYPDDRVKTGAYKNWRNRKGQKK